MKVGVNDNIQSLSWKSEDTNTKELKELKNVENTIDYYLFIDLDGTLINSYDYNNVDKDKFIILDHKNYEVAYIISKDNIVKLHFIQEHFNIVAVTSRCFDSSKIICDKLGIDYIICENGYEYYKKDSLSGEYIKSRRWGENFEEEDVLDGYKDYQKLIKELKNEDCKVVWSSRFNADLCYLGTEAKYKKLIEKYNKKYGENIVIYDRVDRFEEKGIKFSIYFKKISKGEAVEKFISKILAKNENDIVTISTGDNKYTDSYMFEVTDSSIGLKNSGAKIEFKESYEENFSRTEFTDFLLDKIIEMVINKD